MVSDAYRFLIPVLVISGLSAYLGYTAACLALLLLAGFICYFFRNPAREVPAGLHLVVSPADGRIVRVSENKGDTDGEPGGYLISIFLNIFDVHVNRSPISGELERFEYRRGKFRAAFEDEASIVNEQNVLTIRGDRAHVVVKQIAGLIARRVVCWKKQGQRMEKGELIGLIRFGSRVDISLPKEFRPHVEVGDRVKGGSSVLGEFI